MFEDVLVDPPYGPSTLRKLVLYLDCPIGGKGVDLASILFDLFSADNLASINSQRSLTGHNDPYLRVQIDRILTHLEERRLHSNGQAFSQNGAREQLQTLLSAHSTVFPNLSGFLQSSPISPSEDQFLIRCSLVYQLIQLCGQIRRGMTYPTHKYIAYQFALLYCPAIKLRELNECCKLIENEFDQLRSQSNRRDPASAAKRFDDRLQKWVFDILNQVEQESLKALNSRSDQALCAFLNSFF